MSQPPAPHSLRVAVTPEQARAALQNMAEQLAPFREAMQQFARTCAQNASRIMEAFRPLVEHVREHPEALEQWRREREAEEMLGSCHCLCGIHHREQPDIECESVAVPGLTVRYDSSIAGTQHVAMCRPCHGFHTARRARVREPLPATEAVTDTCTCTCWANHPNTPSVCTAASHPQAAISGQPACWDCHDAATQTRD